MAGAGIKEIKTRMTSVESTKQITKAMELVASSKLRRAKEKSEGSKPYFTTLYDTVKDIAQNTKGVESEFLAARKVKNRCYIVIAGDRGLAGGYNANVLKSTVAHMNGNKEKVVTIGKKSYEFFAKRGYDILDRVESTEQCGYEGSAQVGNTVMDLFKKGEIDEVYVSYTEFVSPLVQEPRLVKILPLSFEEEKLNLDKNGKAKKRHTVTNYYQPSPEVVLGYIVPKYVSGIIYGGVVQSYSSEQGARRVAMESATDNANDMLSKLELSYNRARQAAVTQEISEIVGGAEALK